MSPSEVTAIYMNRKRFFQMLLVSPALCALGGALAQGVVVYKHVDESGRVTYSNQPIKGAVVVELSPLMVLPKSQAATLVPQTAKSTPATNPPSIANQQAAMVRDESTTSSQDEPSREPPVASPTAQVQKSPPPQVAIVTSKPPQEVSRKPQMAGASASAPTAGMSAALMAQQRREEVRRRILEGEIEAEAQLLSEAQADLQREQAKSVAMRSLRVAILADEKAIAGKRPPSEDAMATKSVVERHFERVRELQDQVAMHEENLIELKNQLRATPQRTAMKSAQLKPTSATTMVAAPQLR